MTPELESYYFERFSMFSSKGWQDFLEDVKEMELQYNNVSAINTVEEFYKRQGQLDIIHWVLSLKELSEKTYEELNEENL